MDRRDFLILAGLAGALPNRVSQATQVVNPAAPPPSPPDHRAVQIESLVTAKMAEYRVPGVALGIIKDRQLFIRGFGVTNVDDPTPILSNTIFTIASISKTMTATAVMKLVEQGKADLKAPVQKYVPDFRVADAAVTREVTLWHLLTHTPGWEGQLSSQDRGNDALAHFANTVLSDVPQMAPPGAVWSYNNAGFSLAGRAIELITERNIHDALRDLVFTPLGLTRTFTRLTDAATYRLSLGHREQGGGTQVIRPYQSTSGVTAGGVMTTIADLMKYAQFHLGDGAAPDGKPYIKRALLDQMKTSQVRKNSTDDEMGAGWHLRRVGGVMTAAHGGTLNGHCLLIQLVPDRNLAFAILTNHIGGWKLVQDVEAAILKTYEGVALTPNQPIGHRGVNEAITFHSKALATQPKLDEYVGTYRRTPSGPVNVRAENGRLLAGGGQQGGATLLFYGPDVAYAETGAYLGSPYEFIRASDGKVGWIRVNGRIARKDST